MIRAKYVQNIAVVLMLILCIQCVSIAQSGPENGHQNEPQIILDAAVRSTLQKFKAEGLKDDELAVTLIDLRDPETLPEAEYRGDAQIYPASVVKMFYMSYYFRLLEDRKLRPTPEVKRGLRDMIVDSGNEATGYMVDVLTGTMSGPELSAKKFKKWSNKRNAVNRYFASLGYRNINVNQKTHCEDAYGVEQQFRNYKGENRNMLTTNAAARLMKEIVLGQSVNAARSREMMILMKRDWEKPVKDALFQEFVSPALTPGTKLWSKEGYTSNTRHDVAYLETPEGLKLVIAIFTESHSTNQEIIPDIVRQVILGLGGKAA